MNITPTRTLIRRGSLAFALSIVSCVIPMLVRYHYRTLAADFLYCTMIAVSILFLATLGAMIIAFRTAERRGKSLRYTAIASLLAAIPVTLLYYVGELAFIRAFPQLPLLDKDEPATLNFFIATGFADALPLLAVWAGLFLFPAALSAQEDRQRELVLLRREADILRLRSHLEPHFVLNTLNAVSGFVIEDPAQAHELLAALGDLFRDANSFSPQHRMADEIAWLRRYVTIHELRHPELLTVEWKIEPEALDYSCPALIAQPLVENGLMHGALRSRPSRLAVRVAVENESLVVEVRDNGPSLGPRRAGGKGLAIVERRLKLEGSDHDAFSLRREGDETVATIRLPARKAEVAVVGELAHAI